MGKKAQLRYRQVHLDFHTSEYCRDIGVEFDEKQFIGALKKGRVNSVTVFAQCHHGWCYYPTKTGLQHPNLKTDLLGRMLEAGKKADINMPVYITVGWNHKVSQEHPDWIIRTADGRLFGPPPMHPHTARPHTTWYRMCLNTPYLDEVVLAVTKEVLEMYKPSGIFFDITGEFECMCDWCRRDMVEQGLDTTNPSNRKEFARRVYQDYLKKTTELVWGNNPEATIYHNSSDKMGRHDLYPYFSHHEIESLPTIGFWGYDHFPTYVRYFKQVPEFDVLAQTGKFHSSWGEVGGFKNPEALRYEVARIISLGAKCLVGDHLHPRGLMDEEAYRIIGHAYEYVEEREPWLESAEMVADVDILAASGVLKDNAFKNSDFGASTVLMQCQVPFVILDETMDVSPYRVLILPDSVIVHDALQRKLEEYLAGGGALLLSGESGLDATKSRFAIRCGAEYIGPAASDIEYVEVHDPISAEMVRSPFLVYESGVTSRVTDGEVLADTWLPEFNRTYGRFCGHRNTPYDRKANYPSVVRKGNVIHIAQPIFRAYQAMGMKLHRDLVKNCLDLLYPDPLVTVNMPSGGQVSLMRQPGKERLILHLLYATPIKRGQTEVIEDIVPLHDLNVSVRMATAPRKVSYAPSGESIEFTYNGGRVQFTVARLDMHAMIVIQ